MSNSEHNDTADGGAQTTTDTIDFGAAVDAALQAERDPESHRELDPRVFHASQIGYCKRQCYLSKLGLKDTTDALGKFKAGTMIHEFMENEASRYLPDRLEHETAVENEIDGIRFVGHADCFDPENGVVYDFKSRSGWYKHNPPTQRHLDQLYIYMAALRAREGRVVYINKSDPADQRPYPEAGTFEYDASRVAELVAKAQEIRDEIIRNGLPASADEVPFEKCGCWVCDNENLDFPNALSGAQTTDANAGEQQ